MEGKITVTAVKALIVEARAKAKTVYLWDSETKGFGALATKTGACSYHVQYRLGGRGKPTKRFTLGKHGVWTPEQARQLAKEELGKVARGVDAAEQRKDELAKLTGLTFQDAVKKFLSIHARPTRYWHEKRARLSSDDVKSIAKMPMATLKRKHIAGVIDEAKGRSSAAARLLYSDLRPFFKWTDGRELVEKNPIAGLNAPPPAKSRDRVLSDEEIRAFWKAASELNWPFASVFRLLLLTGSRREEVAAMRWAELDLDNSAWFIPGERTKNGRDHRVHLVPQAIELVDRIAIAALKQQHGYRDSELIFSTTGKTPPSGFSKAKRALDARMKEILGPKFKPWRTHDLRRTCATGMENLGIDTRVVETGLNHVSGTKAGIVGVYQRADHREKVKLAFEVWGERVMQIVSREPDASNVW